MGAVLPRPVANSELFSQRSAPSSVLTLCSVYRSWLAIVNQNRGFLKTKRVPVVGADRVLSEMARLDTVGISP